MVKRKHSTENGNFLTKGKNLRFVPDRYRRRVFGHLPKDIAPRDVLVTDIIEYAPTEGMTEYRISPTVELDITLEESR